MRSNLRSPHIRIVRPARSPATADLIDLRLQLQWVRTKLGMGHTVPGSSVLRLARLAEDAMCELEHFRHPERP